MATLQDKYTALDITYDQQTEVRLASDIQKTDLDGTSRTLGEMVNMNMKFENEIPQLKMKAGHGREVNIAGDGIEMKHLN